MRLIIVSGLSGSGKSVALNTLEDCGFYCIDNLPLGLLPALVSKLLNASNNPYEKVAVGIDARNISEDLKRFPKYYDELNKMDINKEILFLEADVHTILKRFSETRRKHPLSTGNIPLAEAIEKERQLLRPLLEHADLHIDTTDNNIHQLRELIKKRIKDKTDRISVLFESFGFKNGIPSDADFVFDVRCLPNPHWEPELRALTGMDNAVIKFLREHPAVDNMAEYIKSFIERWLPEFESDNRSYLTVAIGCTGGHHRSVYIVTMLAEHFRKISDNIQVRHRELS